MSFLILSLPRSRSYWISKYLAYPPFTCGHDTILQCKSLKELIQKYSLLTGSVELSLGLAWQAVVSLFPEVKIVIVRRDIEDVYNSMLKSGVYIPVEQLQMTESALKACSFHPNVKSITYSDLNGADCCEWLFEYCLNVKWDESWFKDFSTQNLQLPIKQRVNEVNQKLPIIQKILLEAALIDITSKEHYVS